jgi:diadenosine tetraphosphate (Ap4A) HIT family hydrolase
VASVEIPVRQALQDCELCRSDGGKVLWRGARLRVVRIDDADYPGFLRVIWNGHVREWTDLGAADRVYCLEAVAAAESVLRDALAPDKMNLASLGNIVSHLHWHVVARFRDDAHFPQPIWGTRQRDPDPAAMARRREIVARIGTRIGATLDALEVAHAGPRDNREWNRG